MSKPRTLPAALCALALLAAACSGTSTGTTAPSPAPPESEATTTTAAPPATDPEPAPASYAGVDPAPEFPPGLDWLNTDRPLTLAELEGKVVLLDFWTYGCINCIHIIPDLERLEREFADELVVIGVHSAKFTNEGATENIRQVVLRYGLEHPVVNDHEFRVWNQWGARAWPTVVLIDPAGNIVGGHSGEGVYPIVQPVIASLVAEFDAAGLVDRSPVRISLEREGLPATILSFPGKVHADPKGDRIFVADTNHNRVVAARLSDGEVLDVYGSGRAGFDDGPARAATFHQPQGLALSSDGATLYVADTNNHAVREVDLVTGEVSTVTGTGVKGRWPPAGGPLPGTPLHSPWDLALDGDLLYVAMAGSHQIWAIDLAAGEAAPFAGNALESTKNGPRDEAELAQPSGLALGDGILYFADSESSAIRAVETDPAGGDVLLVAGSDANLFDFGDVDAVGPAARFQHPLGVSVVGGDLYVADTYNSKIKVIDLAGGRVETLVGGEAGWADGANPLFYEPGGLHAAGGRLYVADTNNHAVRVVDPASGSTSTLLLKGIERFAPAPDDEGFGGVVVTLEPAAVAPGAGTVVLDVALPAGHKVNEDAPSSMRWEAPPAVARFGAGAERDITGTTFPVQIPVEFVGDGDVVGDVTVIWCAADAESLCYIAQLRFVAPITVIEGGAGEVVASYELTLPEL